MSAKIDYLRPKIIGVLSQLDADSGKRSIRKLCNQASGILDAREVVGEEPNRDNVLNIVTQLHGAVQAHNAGNDIAVESIQDIMDGFDNATDE